MEVWELGKLSLLMDRELTKSGIFALKSQANEIETKK